MRPDMSKVIVERERINSADKFHSSRHSKKFKPKDLEDAVTYEGMTRRYRYFHGDAKQLNENLSPLKRYLRSCVGKPWDKVYSEINKHIDVNNAVQAHIRQHIKQYIEFNPIKDTQGNYIRSRRFGRQYLVNGDLFVDSRGILRSAKLKHSKLKLLPGQKLYTIYHEATYPDPVYSGHWQWVGKHCLHVDYVKLPDSPRRHRVMTFIACSTEDIAKALAECNKYTMPVFWAVG